MDLRVLLVCPDQSAAEILNPILVEMGMQSESAPSLAAGLQRLEAEHFDAVLLDYHEGPASREFLTGLRLSAKNRAAQLVAIVDGEHSARPVFGLGASFVLYRPLSAERARISLRAARGLMRRERRRAQRVPVTSAVKFDHPGAEDQPATLLDLSDGGSLLSSDRSLPPACKVYFQFALPGQSQLVRLSGEVAWQDASGRSGIRFLDVPQTSRRLMQGWLQQNAPRSSSANLAMPPTSSLPARPSETRSAPAKSLLEANAANRRGKFRLACKLGAEIYRLGSTVPNRCTLSDISEGGCYVEMPSPLAAQSGIEVVVRTADTRLRIRGLVLTVHPGYGMGVRFTFRDAAEQEEVLRLLAQLAAGPTLDALPR